jgi:phosphatidylglycerol:prolipoprotein diacylglycerol transferase
VLPEIPLLPGIRVYSQTLMLALAVVVGLGLGVYRAGVKAGLGRARVLVAIAAIGLAVFAGGRAHYVINRWQLGYFQERPLEILLAWNGLHAPGALLALIVGGPIVLRLLRLPLGRFIDQFAPVVLAGIALARIGCFLNGCCFGARCSSLFCIAFPPGSPPHRMHLRGGSVVAGGWSEAIHPFQLYIVAICAIAATAAILIQRRARYEGQAGLASIAIYLVGAALVEPLRHDILPAAFGWLGFTQLQVLGTAAAALAVCLLLLIEWRTRRRAAAHPTATRAPRLASWRAPWDATSAD